MEWSTPKHEEIDLNCEISSYANAELVSDSPLAFGIDEGKIL